MIQKRAILAALVGVLALLALIFFRHYPWQLAAPVAVALSIFAYLALGTFERLRTGFRSRWR